MKKTQSKKEETAYAIVSNWRPTKNRNEDPVTVNIMKSIDKLEKGQSFFVPINHCKLHTISHYINKEKSTYRSSSFYISLHAVRDASKKDIGTQVYRVV